MLKKLSLIVVCLFGCMILSCNEKGADPIAPKLTIDSKELTQNFQQSGSTIRLTVESNQTFAAVSSAPEWCEAKADNAKTADNLEISVKPNDNPALRTAEVTVKAEGAEPIKIKITQIGEDPVVLVKEAASGIALADDELDFTLEVTTNLAVDYTLPEWVTQTKSRTVETSTVSFKASALPSELTSRKDTIVIKGNGAEPVKVAIEQIDTRKSGVRFVVVSDTHFDRESAGEDASTRAKKVLDRLFEKYPDGVDAIFIVGDMTDRGTEEQYNNFQNVYYKSGTIPKSVAVYPMIGNHDLYTGTREESHARFLSKTGLSTVNNYVTIKGVPFITISQDEKVEPAYSEATKAWVAASLTDAAQKHPGKPIFVFSHLPVKGTSIASNQGSSEFAQLFAQYPQIVFFCAHTHHSVVDPRSIYQDRFTAINTGTAWYSEVDGGMVGGIEPPGHDKVTEGQIVSVALNSNVTVERWDVFRNEQIMQPYTINAPHDGTQFIYKDRTGGTTPMFEADSKPVALNVMENGCEVFEISIL